MKLYHLGLIAIALPLAAGNAVAAEGDRAPVAAAPAMEILVVTAKRPAQAVSTDAVEDHTAALIDYAVLTMVPEVEPRIEATVDLPALETLEVAPPRFDVALSDIDISRL